VNDFVAVPSAPGLSPASGVTLEAWVRPSVVPPAGRLDTIVAKGDSYSLQLNGPRLEFTTVKGTTRRRVQGPAPIVAGQTYHVVGTFDGRTQRLFVNGVQVATDSFQKGLNANTRPVVFGSTDTTSELLAARIDEVAVYARALTPAQVANHYAAG
ncbi:MAG: LamG domain-containing protein, partial [Acidimicrobiales bacterium]